MRVYFVNYGEISLKIHVNFNYEVQGGAETSKFGPFPSSVIFGTCSIVVVNVGALYYLKI